MDENLCPICSRPMPDGSYNEHHLVPATFKGREKVALHIICHNKLHHTFCEREMANHYNTVDRILEHAEIQKFVKWVQKRPNDFRDKHKDTKDRKRRRKR